MVSKLILLCLFVFTIILFLQIRNRLATPRNFTLLALGDSYSIGEGIEVTDNFPNQLVNFLQKSGFVFDLPDILARTGWTAQDLLQAIRANPLKDQYNIVTLLIGVNNQYQGLNMADYVIDFGKLLKIAIEFAGGRPEAVYVLSIPDWGKTPFAADRDTRRISREIEEYNLVNQRMAEESGANYLATNEAGKDSYQPDELTDDQLHFSSSVYARWSRLLAEKIQNQLA